MRYCSGEEIKTVSAKSADSFDAELKKVTKELKRKGIQYTIEVAPALGFTAFVHYQESYRLPETLADEFELGGEVHRCIECPFYVRPTDGRVKYTRCEITPGLHNRNSCCCDAFYDKLLKGEIELVEVMDVGKEKNRA